MWRRNPASFFGVHLVSSLLALGTSFWAFSTLPSPFFCTSEHDPCSCTGGGFAIFKPFCDALSKSREQNATPASNETIESVRAGAKVEYPGLIESLEGSSTTIIVSASVIVLITLIFGVARSQLAAAKAEKERDEVELQRLELLEQNRRILEELSLNALSEEQVEIVHEGATALEQAVPSRYKIASRKITFEALLGSGSFGDCYKGYFHNSAVAVKQMRVVSSI